MLSLSAYHLNDSMLVSRESTPESDMGTTESLPYAYELSLASTAMTSLFLPANPPPPA